MFPADTADFYQFFFHIKQIIRPSESQPYLKKKKKKVFILLIVAILRNKSIDSIDRYQIFSILAITI